MRYSYEYKRKCVELYREGKEAARLKAKKQRSSKNSETTDIS